MNIFSLVLAFAGGADGAPGAAGFAGPMGRAVPEAGENNIFTTSAPAPSGNGGASPKQPAIRQRFPETWLWVDTVCK